MKITSARELGQTVKVTRRSQKLTQEQLASVSGTGRRFIIELEAGKESCHLGKTLKVLSMLGLEIKVGQKEIS